jgi:flagellar hook-associated protein 3 FlgL
MRITSGMANRRITRDMETARAARQVASHQVSSGKRITRLSDDPAGALDALRARRELQRSQAYNRQASDADGWLTTYDTSLQTISDRLIRVRELSLQGASSGASGGAISSTLNQEISSIRTELASLANQKYLGKPVFAGTAEPASVYSPTFAYQGDNGQFVRTIAAGVTLQVNYNGTAVFGADTSPTQLFAVLQDLESKIASGDAAGLATAISNLDTARERVDTIRVQVGVKQNTVKSIQDQRSSVEVDLRAQLSQAEDVDLAQASIDLNAADLAYKATLSAAARLFQTSLVDFLR